jgi:hypothetical protein
MERDELRRSIVLILVLLAIAILFAQSQRNCEVPGSSWVPCVSLKAIWRRVEHQPPHAIDKARSNHKDGELKSP